MCFNTCESVLKSIWHSRHTVYLFLLLLLYYLSELLCGLCISVSIVLSSDFSSRLDTKRHGLETDSEKAMAPHSSTLAWKIPWAEEPGGLQSMGSLRVGQLSDFTLTFHFHALEKGMATHSSVLAWRIPGMGEPGELPSMGSHRVGHDWSDLAAAAAVILVPGLTRIGMD